MNSNFFGKKSGRRYAWSGSLPSPLFELRRTRRARSCRRFAPRNSHSATPPDVPYCKQETLHEFKLFR
jgi:hypothetical protein